MKRSIIISFVSVFLLIGGCASTSKVTSLEGLPADAPVQKIHLTGDDCKWTPDVIRVAQGTHIILQVESVDWDYDFRLEGYNVSFPIKKGTTVTAEIYASKAGEFQYGCYIETGLHFQGMVGTLIVE